jgi:autotransporter passenger strand-loop-strand repeat protein
MGVIVSAGNSPHNVSSGHTESGDIVVSGGSMFVLSGGKADATIVSYGGALTIDLGGVGSGSVLAGLSERVFGTETGATIKSGVQFVFGEATRTTISGGQQGIAAGGVASITTIKNNGLQNDEGIAITTVASSGGFQDVRSGGTAIGTTIHAGGGQIVEAASKAIGTTISGGSQLVTSTGTATGTTIRTGSETVDAGGTDLGAKIFGGKQDVFGCASGATVFAALQLVESGATASATIVSNGGTLELRGGAIAGGLTVKAGGTLNVVDGYVLNFFNLTGGTLDVAAGGTDTNGGVGAGGKVIILNGGRDLGLNISAGGKEIVSASGADLGTTVFGGGELNGTGSVNDATGALNGPIDTIQLGNSETDVSFGVGQNGLLVLSTVNQANPTAYSGFITGFTQFDGIDFSDIVWVTGDKAIFTNNPGGVGGGVLDVETSGDTLLASLNLAGFDPNPPSAGHPAPYSTLNFNVNADANGDVIITDPPVTWQQPGSASASVGDGEILEIATPDSGNVTFAGASGKLALDQPATFTGAVAGLRAQNSIDLTQIAFGAATTLGYAANAGGTGGILSVSDGAHAASIALLGDYMASTFVTAADGHGGTLIAAAQPPDQALLTTPRA